MFEFIIVAFVSYFMGSIPFGLILSELLGHGDLRKSGSGNIGATNAMRVGGKKLGILTLILDALKGVIPIKLFLFLNFNDTLIALCGIGVVLGHIFPIWLKFKGGKGVATAVAVLLVSVPYVGLVFVFSWILVFALSRTVSLASLCAVLCSTITAFWFATPYFIMSLVLCILIFYRHKDNIKRLLNGTELKFKK
ncbi:glycerol-3-phosphate 1-O-acyltransferase PlsY [Holosporaceae bacterium 'Namur']|nr:glycerol-3-phosphate 1-O-acyltransferase PlsY [Holosporaceae bacterium 'Namur']